ncbi:hypothetical protein ABT56_22035 [Photobacterium aquae]|uniref:KfrA N-terminal DNA-binding domain-containing protein n=1 Tax=Photobacterium aquae TaxID=1195763 RepID=A0A0J1GPS0_9GAMM|nr:hypothetical protein [Photobacterium aquae]KLV01636.1 hypothetical protein ABT56_22035 [Photobacterium aquae]
MPSPISQALSNAIESLIAEGKEPSVALIKARLPEPLPMPVIIKALQSWKSSARVPKIEKSAPQLSAEERISKLEQLVADLTGRLEKLEQAR